MEYGELTGIFIGIIYIIGIVTLFTININRYKDIIRNDTFTTSLIILFLGLSIIFGAFYTLNMFGVSILLLFQSKHDLIDNLLPITFLLLSGLVGIITVIWIRIFDFYITSGYYYNTTLTNATPTGTPGEGSLPKPIPITTKSSIDKSYYRKIYYSGMSVTTLVLFILEYIYLR